MEGSLPGSSVHGILQARVLELGLPFPSPEDLPNPGSETSSPVSPALAGWFFTTGLPGKPKPALMFRESSGGTNRQVTHVWELLTSSSKAVTLTPVLFGG